MIAMCSGVAGEVAVRVAVRIAGQICRRVGFAAAAALVGGVAGLVCAIPQPAFAAPVCDAHLSPAQRERFTLTLSTCGDAVGAHAAAPSGPASTGPAVPHADALVASAARPLAASQTRLMTPTGARNEARNDARNDARNGAPNSAATAGAPESAHLQLFGKPGVVMARMNRPGEAAWAGSATPTTAGVQKTGKVGRTGKAAPASGPLPANGPSDTARIGRPVSRAEELAPQVDAVARRHGIDPLLLHAIAHVESRHNPLAHSAAGALGVMQVMPATGSRFGVTRPEALHQTGTNLEVSAAYLKTLQQRFGNDLSLVLAAYNAGEGAVERYGRRVPPYAETQSYVRQVLEHYRRLNQTAVASAS